MYRKCPYLPLNSPKSTRLLSRCHVPATPVTPKLLEFHRIFSDEVGKERWSGNEFHRHPHMLLTLAEGLRSGYLSDVTFQLGSTTIPAHKLILSYASPVFDTMFNGSLPENDTVFIADVCPKAFLVLLQYLYTSQYPFSEEADQEPTPEELINVLYAARKYDVVELEKKISSHIEDLLSIDTLIPILETSILYDQKDLENKCWECLEYNSDKFFHSEAFSQLQKPTLELVLKRDCLSITEIKIFLQVERWARVECQRQDLDPSPANIRHVLEGALSLIRFPTMKPHEFADGPAISGILTDAEITNVLLCICSSSKPSGIFSGEPRRWRNPEIYSECFCNNNSRNNMNSRVGRNCNFCHADQEAEDKRPGILFHSPATPPRYCACRTRAFCPSKRRFGPH